MSFQTTPCCFQPEIKNQDFSSKEFVTVVSDELSIQSNRATNVIVTHDVDDQIHRLVGEGEFLWASTKNHHAIPTRFTRRLSHHIWTWFRRTRSTDKVINQELRGAAVMCGEELPIRRGVRESNLLFAQV